MWSVALATFSAYLHVADTSAVWALLAGSCAVITVMGGFATQVAGFLPAECTEPCAFEMKTVEPQNALLVEALAAFIVV